MSPMPNRVKVKRHFQGLIIETNNFAFEIKVVLGLETTLNYFTGWVGGWVAGNCETITNSASAEARVETQAELGNFSKLPSQS